MPTWNDVSSQLAEPFDPKDVQWRAGSVSRDKKRAQALAYAEPRIYENRLDELLGSAWECRFQTWGDQRLVCEVTLWLENGLGETQPITRSSSGEFDSSDRIAQGTVAEAQAFKRACSKFGLGRYLYDLPAAWVGYDESTRRLTETPTLPKSARPQQATANEPTLSESRASVLGQSLLGFGFPNDKHAALATRVLDRQIKKLTDLTEPEGLKLYTYAKQSAPTAV